MKFLFTPLIAILQIKGKVRVGKATSAFTLSELEVVERWLAGWLGL